MIREREQGHSLDHAHHRYYASRPRVARDIHAHPNVSCRRLPHSRGIRDRGEHGFKEFDGCIPATGWALDVCGSGAWMGQLIARFHRASTVTVIVDILQIWRAYSEEVPGKAVIVFRQGRAHGVLGTNRWAYVGVHSNQIGRRRH